MNPIKDIMALNSGESLTMDIQFRDGRTRKAQPNGGNTAETDHD